MIFVKLCIIISAASVSGYGNRSFKNKVKYVAAVTAKANHFQHTNIKDQHKKSTDSFFSLQSNAAVSTTDVDGVKDKKPLLSSFTQRTIKFFIFSTILIRSFALEKLINYSTLGQCFILGTLATSCALRRIEDCYSYGYGGSLLLLGLVNGADILKSFNKVTGGDVLTLASIGNPLIIIKKLNSHGINTQIMILGCLLQAFAYILYGIRMLTFIYKRNNSISYLNSDRSQRMVTMDKKVSLSKRIFIWLSTAILLGGFYTLPLHLHCNSIIQSLTTTNMNPSNNFTSIVSCVAGIIGIIAVIIQYLADNQKHEHKEKWYHQQQQPPQSFDKSASSSLSSSSLLDTPFCTNGLYSIWRHPNYVSEFIFHVSMFVASFPAMIKSPLVSVNRALTTTSSSSITSISMTSLITIIYKALSSILTSVSWKTVILCLQGPLIFGSIIIAATRSLEKRQNDEYGNNSRFANLYQQWIKSTKRFL